MQRFLKNRSDGLRSPAGEAGLFRTVASTAHRPWFSTLRMQVKKDESLCIPSRFPQKIARRKLFPESFKTFPWLKGRTGRIPADGPFPASPQPFTDNVRHGREENLCGRSRSEGAPASPAVHAEYLRPVSPPAGGKSAPIRQSASASPARLPAPERPCVPG